MKKILTLLSFLLFFVMCKEKTASEIVINSDHEILDSIYIYVAKYSENVKLDSLRLNLNTDNKKKYAFHLEKILERYNSLSVYIKNENIAKVLYEEMDSIQMEIINYR